MTEPGRTAETVPGWARAMAVLAPVAFAGCGGGTMAQRLGYPADARLLIVHADDLGTFRAVNDAVAAARPLGLITSCSANVPGRAIEAFAAFCREHPGLDVGVHVTLSSEFRTTPMKPVSAPERVGSLVGADGAFPPWLAEGARADEVAREIRAQIRRAIDLGLRPTHVDTHMGTALVAPYAVTRAYIEAAREFRLPAMVPSPRSRRLRAEFGKSRLLGLIGPPVYRVRTRGVVYLDQLVADVEWDERRRLAVRRERFKQAIRDLAPGVTQLIIHPALDAPEMPRGRDWEWFTTNRVQDFAIFNDPEMKAFVEAQGVELVTWRRIREAVFPGAG